MTGGLDFFFYGTLRDAAVRDVVMGPALTVVDAVLPGFRVAPVEGGRFPCALADPSHDAMGILVPGVDLAAAVRLSFFEGDGYDYDVTQRTVRLADGSGSAVAWVYLPGADLKADPGVWDLAAWTTRHREGFLANARTAMGRFDTADVRRYRVFWEERAGAP